MFFSFAGERPANEKPSTAGAAGLRKKQQLPQAGWILSGRLSRPVKNKSCSL